MYFWGGLSSPLFLGMEKFSYQGEILLWTGELPNGDLFSLGRNYITVRGKSKFIKEFPITEEKVTKLLEKLGYVEVENYEILKNFGFYDIRKFGDDGLMGTIKIQIPDTPIGDATHTLDLWVAKTGRHGCDHQSCDLGGYMHPHITGDGNICLDQGSTGTSRVMFSACTKGDFTTALIAFASALKVANPDDSYSYYGYRKCQVCEGYVDVDDLRECVICGTLTCSECGTDHDGRVCDGCDVSGDFNLILIQGGEKSVIPIFLERATLQDDIVNPGLNPDCWDGVKDYLPDLLVAGTNWHMELCPIRVTINVRSPESDVSHVFIYRAPYPVPPRVVSVWIKENLFFDFMPGDNIVCNGYTYTVTPKMNKPYHIVGNKLYDMISLWAYKKEDNNFFSKAEIERVLLEGPGTDVAKLIGWDYDPGN